jgi:peptide/nickel transport system substrate-binding protein
MFWEPFSGIKYGSIESCAKDLAGVDNFEDVPADVLQQVYDEWVGPAVEVKSGNIVEFKLPAPYPPLLQILTHGASWSAIYSKAWAISKGAWDGEASTWQNYHDPQREEDPLYDSEMGSGPYILVKWDPGVEVTMDAFEDYWAGSATIKHAVLKTVEEWGTRRLMLEAGDADIAYVPRQYLSQVEGMEGVRIVRDLPALSNAVVFFNSGVTEGSKYVGSAALDGNGIPLDFFTNLDVRKAFCYAFDYQTYIDEAWLGQAIQPTGPIVDGLAYYPEESPVYTYDLEKAEESLKAAMGGELWEKGFKFTAVYNSGNDQRKIALEIVRDNIESLNPKFHIDVVGVQWSSFLDALVGGQMPLYMLGWLADYPDPHNFVSPYMQSEGTFMGFQGDALINLAKTTFDPLIEKGITQLAPEDRRATYAELQKLAYDYAIDIFPVQAAGVHVEQTWVQGWYYNPMRPGTDFYSLSKSE